MRKSRQASRGSSNLPILPLLLAAGLVIVVAIILSSGPSQSTDIPENGPGLADVLSPERQESASLFPGEGLGPARVDPSDSQDTRTTVVAPASPLPRGGLIQGSVVNPAGEPVLGALVVLERQYDAISAFATTPGDRGEPLDQHRAQSDKNGRYTFRNLPSGRDYDMWVRHPDYAPRQGVGVTVIGESQELAPIMLGVGYSLSGKITASAGNPLAADLELNRQSVQWSPAPAEDLAVQNQDLGRHILFQAAQDGTYNMDKLPEGLWMLTASHEGYASGRVHPVVLMNNNRHLEQDISLGTEHTLSGIVRLDDGTPVSGVKVEASRVRPRPMFSAQTLSADDGSFLLRGLPKGLYGLGALAEGFSNAHLPRVQSNAKDLELVMHKRGGVSGRLVGPTGPIEHGSLELFRVNIGSTTFGPTGKKITVKSPDGSFVFSGLEPGTYRLLGRAAGFAPAYTPTFTVQRDIVQGMDAQLVAGGRLVGQVLSGGNGNPLRGAEILIHGRDWTDQNTFALFGGPGPDPNNIPSQSTTTRADGRFELTQTFPGSLKIEIRHDAHLPQFIHVEVGDGATVDLGSFRLEQGATIRGVGSYADGRPLAGGTAYLTLQSGEAFGGYAEDQRLDSQGRFLFKGLKPGTYRVSAAPGEASGFLFLADADQSAQTVSISAGKTLEVKLRSRN